ncbi:MAG TPA: phosphate ABC transporter substrate-binding protein PstS [Myxococcales bacterium]|jgi:phosphate transport system substrate-binding protein
MRRLFGFALLAAFSTVAGACNRSVGGSGGTMTLNGAGATFPYPLYSKWVAEYGQREPVRINYQSIGSGGGIRQITERTVDFGASDAPMTDEQLAKAPGKILHIPTTLGAVALSYNLPEVGSAKLRVSPEALAGIYLGQITSWNDPNLVELNPGVALPNKPIVVVHRSDGSGTTAVFTDYLSKVSPGWKAKVGSGTSVAWPAGMGAKGNEGVTGQVKTTPGALGYLELAYALQSSLPVMAVRNGAGAFTSPAIESIGAAASGAAQAMPDDLRVSIVDAPGANAYPISSFTYVLLYEAPADRARGQALARFLWWAVHDGQRFGPALHYAPLPPAVVAKVEGKLKPLLPPESAAPTPAL